jgi:hypothetical protein
MDGEIHATRNLADKNWQGRKCGKEGRERARDGDRRRELEKTLETQGVLNIRRRRVTFILDYFPVSGEGE